MVSTNCDISKLFRDSILPNRCHKSDLRIVVTTHCICLFAFLNARCNNLKSFIPFTTPPPPLNYRWRK